MLLFQNLKKSANVWKKNQIFDSNEEFFGFVKNFNEMKQTDP